VSAELTAEQADALRAAAGVNAVSATRTRGSVGVDLGTTKETVTIIAVDQSYAAIVESLPGHPDASIFRELSERPMVGDALSIVVAPNLAGQIVGDDVGMYYGPTSIDLDVIGTTDFAPDGYVSGPVAYVDFDAVSALTKYEFPANSFLVSGVGTDEGVQQLSADTVLSRTDWVEQRRGLALVAGVERTMLFAVVAVALLAVVALVATVVSGAKARGRALSLLRTLGMRPRLGWWLALAELAPLVIAAVLGGVAAGVTVVVALAPSLGLDVLAGGTALPAPNLSPLVILGLVAAAIALLALGALADVLVHRRDKLSEVLRVGETV
jgi:putative ABC transport system permease protein